MKRILLLTIILFFLFSSNSVFGQVPIAYYDFEDNNNRNTVAETSLQESITGIGSPTTNIDAALTVSNGTGAGVFNGGTNTGYALGYYGFTTSGSSTSSNPSITFGPYNCNGFATLSISFDALGVGVKAPTNADIYWSTDNISYIRIVPVNNVVLTSGWSNLNFNFPVAIDGAITLYFKIIGYNAGVSPSAGNGELRIDNLRLSASKITTSKTLMNVYNYGIGLSSGGSNIPVMGALEINGSGISVSLSSDTHFNNTITLSSGELVVGPDSLIFQSSNTPVLRNGTTQLGTITTNSLSNLGFGTTFLITGASFVIPDNVFTTNAVEIKSFTISRTNSIIWNNQSLTLNGQLNLQRGIFDIAENNTLTFQNGDTPLNRTNGQLALRPTTNLVFGTSGNTGGNTVTIGDLNTFTTQTPTINNLTINRTNGVQFNNTGFKLTLNGTLNLILGTFDISPASVIADVLVFQNADVPIIRTLGTLTVNFRTGIVFNSNSTLFTIPDGTFISPTPFLGSLTINRLGGVRIGNQPLNISGSLNLFSGVFDILNTTLTFQSGNSPIVRTNGTLTIGSSANIFFGTGAARLGNSFTIPNDVFTTDPILNTVSIFRNNNLVWNNQPLTIKGSLFLNLGVFDVGSCPTLTFQNGDVPITKSSGFLTVYPTTNIVFGVSGNTNGAAFSISPNTFTSAPSINNLTIFRDNNLTLGNQALTINGTLNLQTGVFDIAANTLTFQNGDVPITRTSGTLTLASGASIIFGTVGNIGGAAFTIPAAFFTSAAPSFAGFTINRTNSIKLSQPCTLSTGLNLTLGQLDNSSSNITMANNSTITRTLGSLSSVPIFGTLAADRIAVIYNGSGVTNSGNELPLSPSPGAIGALTISSGTYILQNDITTNNILVSASSILDASTKIITPRASASVTINGTFKTSNTNGFTGAANTSLANTNSFSLFLASSTIEFSSALSHSITSRVDYNSITLSGASSKSLIGITIIGGVLKLSTSNDKLSIGNNTLTLNGTIDATSSGSIIGALNSNLNIGGTGLFGNLNLDQTTDGITNALSTLTINRLSSGTVTLNSKLVLIDVLTPTNGTLQSNGYLHLRSNANNTARISAGNSNGGYVSGDVTVERYITALNNRAYRFLASTVNTTSTIRDNWQEGVNNNLVNLNVNSPISGYGTHITGSGSGNGFDATQNNSSSLFTLNQTSTPQVWVPVSNTNVNTLDATTGYLVFIRGNRDNINTINTIPAFAGSSNLTLRAKGTLLQGTQILGGLQSDTRFSLIANPFASPISWSSIYTGGNTLNFESAVTIWDPNINTSGGYVTITNGNIVAGGLTNLTTSIQSGQAFFVHTKAGINNPTLTITENDKTTTNNLNVFRAGLQTEQLNIQLKYNNVGSDFSADGVLAIYNNNYSNGVDSSDIEQISNWDEDVAIIRNGKELSIECRDLIDNYDTLYLQIARVNKITATYRWEIESHNFNAPNLEAFLIDSYTNTSTPISLYSITVINFNVTSNVASQAPDRFKIVFKKVSALSINTTQLKAFQKGSEVVMQWNTNNETDIRNYQVEKSNNGFLFSQLSTVLANHQNSFDNNYTSTDFYPSLGNNFYRIKILRQDGSYTYSQIIKIIIDKRNFPEIVVYPNPIIGNQLNMQFINIKKGKYEVKILNNIGQVIDKYYLGHDGGSSTQTINLHPNISNGNYVIEVTGENGLKSIQPIQKNK